MQLFLGSFYQCSSDQCFAPLGEEATVAAIGPRVYPNCTVDFVEAAVENTEFPLQFNTTVCCLEGAFLRCQARRPFGFPFSTHCCRSGSMSAF
jgi:hypothetical protein